MEEPTGWPKSHSKTRLTLSLSERKKNQRDQAPCQVLDHAGLLFNEAPGIAEVLFV
jgi:hypothetical protein